MNLNRRRFIHCLSQTTAAAALIPKGLSSYAAHVGLHEKVRLGVIGCGGMGGRHIEALAVDAECEVVALCDVFQPRYEQWQAKVEELSGKRPEGYQDFRRLLDRKDIDAIFVVTPDHWHPLLAILGCQAGKDVYVENRSAPRSRRAGRWSTPPAGTVGLSRLEPSSGRCRSSKRRLRW